MLQSQRVQREMYASNMASVSTLKILGILLLLISSVEVEAGASYRGKRSHRNLKNTRGIGGVQNRSDYYSSKGGKGGGKAGGRYQYYGDSTTGSPTASPTLKVDEPNIRVPVPVYRPVPAPIEPPVSKLLGNNERPSFWFPSIESGQVNPSKPELEPELDPNVQPTVDFSNQNIGKDNQLEVNVDEERGPSAQAGNDADELPSATGGNDQPTVDFSNQHNGKDTQNEALADEERGSSAQVGNNVHQQPSVTEGGNKEPTVDFYDHDVDEEPSGAEGRNELSNLDVDEEPSGVDQPTVDFSNKNNGESTQVEVIFDEEGGPSIQVDNDVDEGPSEIEGRNDEPTIAFSNQNNGEDTESVVSHDKDGESSAQVGNNVDELPSDTTDEEDDRSDAFQDLFSSVTGNSGTSIEIGNGNDDGKEPNTARPSIGSGSKNDALLEDDSEIKSPSVGNDINAGNRDDGSGGSDNQGGDSTSGTSNQVNKEDTDSSKGTGNEDGRPLVDENVFQDNQNDSTEADGNIIDKDEDEANTSIEIENGNGKGDGANGVGGSTTDQSNDGNAASSKDTGNDEDEWTSVDGNVVQHNQNDSTEETGSITNNDEDEATEADQTVGSGGTESNGGLNNEFSGEEDSVESNGGNYANVVDSYDENGGNVIGGSSEETNNQGDKVDTDSNKGTGNEDGLNSVDGNMVQDDESGGSIIKGSSEETDNQGNKGDTDSNKGTGNEDGLNSVDGNVVQNDESGGNVIKDSSEETDNHGNKGDTDSNKGTGNEDGLNSVDGNVVQIDQSDATQETESIANNDEDKSNEGDQTVGSWDDDVEYQLSGEGDSESNNQEVDGESGDEYISDSSAAVFCPEVSPDKETLVNWIYAIEFNPDMTAEEKTEAVTIMELKLVSEILECNQAIAVLPGKRFIRGRNLLDGNDIAGLNYMPLDAKNDDVVCFSNPSSGGVCETYFGRMEMYLQDDADEKVAVNKILHSIRDTMQRRNDFPAVDGIVQVWYLNPELNDVLPSEVSNGVIGDTPKPPIDGSFSTGTMIAFAALGVFVFVALILGAFKMRRNEHDGFSTLEPGSSMTCSAITPANDSYGAKQSSTFNRMLPNSYKLEESDGMSAIPEGDSDSDSRYDGSVIVSDGGYTSDGDSRVGGTSPHHFDPVLGAHQLDDDNLDTDRDLLFENTENYEEISSSSLARTSMKFESDREFSNHRKSNLVTPSEASLGARHSTVDVHQCNSARCKICNYKPQDVEFVHNSPNSPDVSTGKFFNEIEGNDEEEQ